MRRQLDRARSARDIAWLRRINSSTSRSFLEMENRALRWGRAASGLRKVERAIMPLWSVEPGAVS